MQCSDWGLISLYAAFLLEDSARLQELAADSERIIPNLVTNLDLQLEKDNLISEVMETNEEELQLQLKEVCLCTYNDYSTYSTYIVVLFINRDHWKCLRPCVLTGKNSEQR